MSTKINIALGAMLIACISSTAMAESGAPNAGARFADSPDVASASLLLVAAHKSPRSRHLRLRQSRNAGLPTGGLPGGRVNDNNYQYWREACCL
jgi:hypothetical protein